MQSIRSRVKAGVVRMRTTPAFHILLPASQDFVVLGISVSIAWFFRQALSSGGFSLLETECCIDVFPVPHFCTDLISCFLIVRLLPGSITILLSLPLFVSLFSRDAAAWFALFRVSPPLVASSRCVPLLSETLASPCFFHTLRPFPEHPLLRSALAHSPSLFPSTSSPLLFLRPASCLLPLPACRSFSCMISRRRR